MRKKIRKKKIIFFCISNPVRKFFVCAINQSQTRAVTPYLRRNKENQSEPAGHLTLKSKFVKSRRIFVSFRLLRFPEAPFLLDWVIQLANHDHCFHASIGALSWPIIASLDLRSFYPRCAVRIEWSKGSSHSSFTRHRSMTGMGILRIFFFSVLPIFRISADFCSFELSEL